MSILAARSARSAKAPAYLGILASWHFSYQTLDKMISRIRSTHSVVVSYNYNNDIGETATDHVGTVTIKRRWGAMETDV